jgi:hypothetical protein
MTSDKTPQTSVRTDTMPSERFNWRVSLLEVSHSGRLLINFPQTGSADRMKFAKELEDDLVSLHNDTLAAHLLHICCTIIF